MSTKVVIQLDDRNAPVGHQVAIVQGYSRFPDNINLPGLSISIGCNSVFLHMEIYVYFRGFYRDLIYIIFIKNVIFEFKIL